MSQLKIFTGAELAYLSTSIAIAISNGLDNEDVNILSSFFNSIGDSLGIIAATNEAARVSNQNTVSSAEK